MNQDQDNEDKNKKSSQFEDEINEEFDYIVNSAEPTASEKNLPNARANLIKKVSVILGVVLLLIFAYIYSGKKENQDLQNLAMDEQQPSLQESTLQVDVPPATKQELTITEENDAATAAETDSSAPVNEFTSVDELRENLFDQMTDETSVTSSYIDSINPVSTIDEERFNRISTELREITQQVQSNTFNVNNVSNALDRIQTQLNEFAKQSNSVQSKMQNLSNDIVSIDASIKSLRKALSSEEYLYNDVNNANSNYLKSKAKKVSIQDNLPIYSIHAIIPGRVWLKDKEGVITSYMEGDILSDRGKIVVIDPLNYIVMTSTGEVYR